MADLRAHICFVAPNAFPLLADRADIQFSGGAELQQVVVARGLAKRGYRVSMVCLDYGQPDEVVIDGIRVLRAYGPDQGLPVIRFFWPRMTSILRCLRRVDADVYYQRAASVTTGIVVGFCRVSRKKSVFAVAGEPMIPFVRDRLIYEAGVRYADRVLVQNQSQAEVIKSRFGRDSSIVPNGLDSTEHLTGRLSAGSRILWVSTIRRLKRPDLFLDLAAAMPQYAFRLVGGPASEDPQLFDSIQERAGRLPNVEFVGFVPFAKVGEHYDAAALLVNTSETEGYPNTFLQAWVRGVPTVSFIDCGAQMDGRVPGRVVSSVGEMSTAIVELMGDDIQRSDEGAFCRNYALREHALPRVLDVYEQVIADLTDAQTVVARQ